MSSSVLVQPSYIHSSIDLYQIIFWGMTCERLACFALFIRSWNIAIRSLQLEKPMWFPYILWA